MLISQFGYLLHDHDIIGNQDRVEIQIDRWNHAAVNENTEHSTTDR